MTFIKFIEARIAIDEAVARRAQRGYQHVLGIPHWFTANSDTSVAMTPRVALAQCEAIRRVLDLRESCRAEGVRAPAVTQPMYAAQLSAYDAALRSLATIWSDHPDYDEVRRS